MTIISDNKLEFYKTVLKTVFFNGLALGISFIGSVILTRALGVEGRGIVAWVMALSSVGVILAQAGMGQTNRRYVAARLHRSPTLFLLTTIICGAFGLVAGAIAIVLGLQHPIGQQYVLMLILAMLSIPIFAISIAGGEMLIGMKRNRQYMILNTIEKSTNTLLIILLVICQLMTPTIAVVALVLSGFFRLFAVVYFLRDIITLKLKNAKQILSYTVKYCVFNYVSSSSLFLAAHISVIYLGIYSNVNETGWFAANMIIINALRQFANTIGLYALPKLSTTKNVEEKLKLKKEITFFTMIIAIGACLFFAISAKWIIPVIYGADFAGGVKSFYILLIGFFFCSILFVLQAFIAAENKGYIIIVSPIILIVGNFVACVFLVEPYGALGAAYGWMLSQAVASIFALMSVIILHRRLLNS